MSAIHLGRGLRQNPCPQADGHDETLRLGKRKEAIVQRGHGTWYEAASRKCVFISTQPLDEQQVSFPVVTGTVGCCLLNPPTSNRILIPIEWITSIHNPPSAGVNAVALRGTGHSTFMPADDFINPPNDEIADWNVASDIGTKETIFPALLGENSRGAAIVITNRRIQTHFGGGILPPILFLMVEAYRGVNTTRPFQQIFRISFEGRCVMPPGSFLDLVWVASFAFNDPRETSTIIWQESDL